MMKGYRSLTVDCRKRLRLERNAVRRAEIYLELVRLYRTDVRMKNARLELRRAFESIGHPWPSNSIFGILGALGLLLGLRKLKLHPEFEAASPEVQVSLLTELYENFGLSAYYFRQTPLLIISMLFSRRSLAQSGTHRGRVTWFGGSGCITALLGLRAISLRYIARAHKAAEESTRPEIAGKALIWEALAHDYLGDPVRSARIFEDALDRYGARMEPTDIRLASTTLAINYNSRGHSHAALEALNRIQELVSERDFLGPDSASWYAIASYAFLNREQEITRLIKVFRSILSADNDEKWLVTQFLGNLLIANYWTNHWTDRRDARMSSSVVDDLIRRFEHIGLKPRKTHREACFYWVAKAYTYSHDLDEPGRKRKFLRALRSLKSLPRHPTTESHRLALEAYRLLNSGRASAFLKASDRAEKIALECGNSWALYEILSARIKFQRQAGQGNGIAEAQLVSRLETIVRDEGWGISGENGYGIQQRAR